MNTATLVNGRLEIVCRSLDADRPSCTIFIAVNYDLAEGSAVVPFGRSVEGSTVFLPFRADHLYAVAFTPGAVHCTLRHWTRTVWGPAEAAPAGFEFAVAPGEIRISCPAVPATGPNVLVSVYRKDMTANEGWGWMIADAGAGVAGGTGDQAVGRFQQIDTATGAATIRNRLGGERARIYQLLPRLFGNTNETRKPNGTLAENGVGKFADLTDAALSSIREMGFTHLWLTGVLQQMTATDYSSIDEPADDPDLLKGLAGSPYAIRDYFDLCPDYAVRPEDRRKEFEALLGRAHAIGFKVIVDFVPNHVARSYYSNIRPELSFGAKDDRRQFFHPQNNFFHLRPEDEGLGPPLVLPTMRDGHAVSPTCQVLGTCDGLYGGELQAGRVTGNNVVSWRPGITDWYETVKLNYGYDFTTGAREYPAGEQREKALPDTWLKMDRILAHWQEMGVDGFRCDMAHMEPPEFWNWAIGRARARQPAVWFMAEAYDNDPAKVRSANPVLLALDGGRGNVMYDLLAAGFDAVYDDPSYKRLKALYDGPGWANDLDGSFPHPYVFHNSLRYAENHDEVRLASREWGGVGAEVGRPVSAILYGLGRGPVLLYHGQEVGEPAQGVAGFCTDQLRTTIFDYWSMPEFVKWVNGHRYDGGRLSPEQKALREFYSRLVNLVGEPAFRDGEFFPVNPVNNQNERFGRLPGEPAGGHWLYAFVRSAGSGGQHFLVVANLHPKETLSEVQIRLSPESIAHMALRSDHPVQLSDRLQPGSAPLKVAGEDFASRGLTVPRIPPLSAAYFELTQ